MTCQNCKNSVTEALGTVDGVDHVEVDLENDTATLTSKKAVDLGKLEQALPEKFSIIRNSTFSENEESSTTEIEDTKLRQLRPLFLILGYISVASMLLNLNPFQVGEMMYDFMGLFFIVFAFFKILDVNGFAESFRMYDPIAKMIPWYGKVYPFLETLLGLMFLYQWKVSIALIATLVVLGFTTYGVTRSLIDKRKIKCACLGTVLDLPMTEATLIENTIMIVMAITMLIHLYLPAI